MPAADDPARPKLLSVTVGADAGAWRAVGFAVSATGHFRAGDVAVQIVHDGPLGLLGWTLSNPVAGLPAGPVEEPPPDAPTTHPNGVTGIDHVVVATTVLDETTDALVAAGCEVRGERRASFGGRHVVQRFLPLQNALIELVADGDPAAEETVPAAAFWGLTFLCPGLNDGVAALGPHVSSPRPAVQPGRTIATAGPEASLGTQVAFMTPRPR